MPSWGLAIDTCLSIVIEIGICLYKRNEFSVLTSGLAVFEVYVTRRNKCELLLLYKLLRWCILFFNTVLAFSNDLGNTKYILLSNKYLIYKILKNTNASAIKY